MFFLPTKAIQVLKKFLIKTRANILMRFISFSVIYFMPYKLFDALSASCLRKFLESVCDVDDNANSISLNKYQIKLSKSNKIIQLNIDSMDSRFSRFNPSMCLLENKVYMTYTLSNRSWNLYRFPKTIDSLGFFSSICLSISDEIQGSQYSGIRFSSAHPIEKIKSSKFKEYADTRIFSHKGRLYISSCISQRPCFSDGSTHKIALGSLNIFGNVLDKFSYLDSPFGETVEKNWMPIDNSQDSAIDFIYTVNPLVSLSYDSHDLLSPPVINESSVHIDDLNFYRGGTNLTFIRHLNCYVAVVHKTYHRPQRHYIHRFIAVKKISNQYQVVSYSDPFFFESRFDIEFATSLLVVDDRIYVGYGYRDSSLKFILLSDYQVGQYLRHDVNPPFG